MHKVSVIRVIAFYKINVDFSFYLKTKVSERGAVDGEKVCKWQGGVCRPKRLKCEPNEIDINGVCPSPNRCCVPKIVTTTRKPFNKKPKSIDV